MKKFIKAHWQSIVIVLIAGWIIHREYQALDFFYQWRIPTAIENPFFVAMASWSIRFLLLSLLMSPIYAFTGWRLPLKLRKPTGLVAFGFASIHAGIHFSGKFTGFENYDLIFRLTNPSFVIYGAIAFAILALMAMTSIKLTMKLLGRFWKPLHRMVYVAGVLIMIHIMLSASSGKRHVMGGEEALVEYRIYLVILIVLLVVRVPIIKRGLQRVIPFAPTPRKSKPKKQILAS